VAARSLIVLAKVQDLATSNLKKIQKEFKGTGKAVKETGVNFTEFNRIMFSTSAFIGMFSGAFRKISSAVEEGAQVDRVAQQFERVLGPKGKFFEALDGLTDNTIDKMEAMRSGISLASLGIADNMGQVAGIVAQAGTAAKMAGLDSAEGIKKYTEFLKTGSVSQLSFLNILAETNPALQAQMAILAKAGGPLGHVITTQQKLAIGMSLLKAATEGQLKGHKDLLDRIQAISQSFFFFRIELGKFLGQAFAPLLDKLPKALDSFTGLLDRVRSNDKEFGKFIKNMVIAASAIAGVIATVGTLRLVFKALGALGIGSIPFMAMSIVGMASAFTDLDSGLGTIVNAFKLMGSVLFGTTQLMASFFHSQENSRKGIGFMDKQLHDLLEKNDLLGFTLNLARAGIAAVEFGKGLGEGVKAAVDYLDEKFGGLIKKFKEFFGIDHGPWSRSLIKSARDIGKVVGEVGMAVLGVWAGFKLLGGAKTFLSKIPFVGKLFGGGGMGRGPAGTAADPIYTRSVSDVSGLLSRVGGMSDYKPIEWKPGTITGKLKKLFSDLKDGLFSAILAIKSFGKSLPIQALKTLGLVGLAAAAGWGIGLGINKIDKEFLGGTIAKGIDFLIDKTAGLFGMKGSTAETNRMEALQTSPGYTRIVQAGLAAGNVPNPDKISEIASKLPDLSEGQRNMFYSNAPRTFFEEKFMRTAAGNLLRPEMLGLDQNNQLVNTPEIMPGSEQFREEQIRRTMALLNDSQKKAMKDAFDEAMSDNNITKEEWVAIYKKAIDSSTVAKHKPDKPDPRAGKVRGGC
jgi:hypothetical protein